MHTIAAAALLLFTFSPIASADVIYTYTGAPFDNFSGPWDPVFGPTPPTQITATVQVASPFPDPIPSISEFENCGFVGSLGFPGGIPGIGGIISATISDGARTFSSNQDGYPDEIFLAGCGTHIDQWHLGAGFAGGSSDARDIVTEQFSDATGELNVGDSSFFQAFIFDSSGIRVGEADYQAFTSVPGQWTAIITPEVNTGSLALISCSLLLLGYRRRY